MTPEDTKQLAIKLYLEPGGTIKKVSERLQINWRRLSAWLDEAGIPRKKPKEVKIDPDLLRELYIDREWPASRIGRYLNASTTTILQRLAQHNIPTRHNHQTPVHFNKDRASRVMRKCLMCGKQFSSTHVGNRRCRRCNDVVRTWGPDMEAWG